MSEDTAERQEVPEAAVETTRARDVLDDAIERLHPRDGSMPTLDSGDMAQMAQALHMLVRPALGDQRLVPYGQARAEVLGEAVEWLRSESPSKGSGHPYREGFDAAIGSLSRHFDLPTQGAREEMP